MIWSYFIDLNNARQSGMSVNPISYSEIDAYFRLNDIVPFDFEVKAIKTLDNIMLKVYSERQKEEQADAANKQKAKGKK